ncbi:hypothetical protein AB0J35_03195 [Nonomuraea angiospora]
MQCGFCTPGFLMLLGEDSPCAAAHPPGGDSR